MINLYIALKEIIYLLFLSDIISVLTLESYYVSHVLGAESIDFNI